MRLAGKATIITGAGSGFGAGMARMFAAEGAMVVVNDLNPTAADEVVGAIRAGGGQAVAASSDVSTAAGVADVVAQAKSHYDRVDVLINNAGYTHTNQSLLTVSETDFDRVFSVNVKSIYHFTRAVVPLMRASKGGSIINVGSVGAIRPRPGLGWYCGAKGAVITLSKVMAIEFAPDDIRVNCICPAAADTGMMLPSLGEDTPERRARVLSTIPLGRLATPEDVAGMAAFLASAEATFLTGGVYLVDGGRAI